MSAIHLYVYDLSKGMAAQFSLMMLGKHFDGVWHTGIVAYGKEWFFGNLGVDRCPPKTTLLGEPNDIIKLGDIEMDEDDFLEIIQQLSDGAFKVGTYNLLEHNCNNFSHELSTLLLDKGIPQHILDLPKQVMNTPLGPMLKPMLEKAADPIHQNQTDTSGLPKIFTKTGKNETVTEEVKRGTEDAKNIPNTINLFKPEVSNDFDLFLNEDLDFLKTNEKLLLSEIKEYLQQVEITWSISKNHIKVLFDIYFSKNIQESAHLLTIIRLLQKLSAEKSVSHLISENPCFIEKLLPNINSTDSENIKKNILQMFSNVCAHNLVSKSILQNHQDILFKELSDFVLIEADSDHKKIIHESSVSLFFNLISAYHLESDLKEANALSLGVALLERLPKMNMGPGSTYHVLALTRSCLSVSENMRGLASSMEFDISRYQSIDSNGSKKE